MKLVWNFAYFWLFEIVSNFEFRASNFLLLACFALVVRPTSDEQNYSTAVDAGEKKFAAAAAKVLFESPDRPAAGLAGAGP
jgi:hypothetical protein